MLIGLLICGIIAGTVAAVVSLIAGFTLWPAIGFYILGSVIGTLASSLSILLRLQRSANAVDAGVGRVHGQPESLSSRG